MPVTYEQAPKKQKKSRISEVWPPHKHVCINTTEQQTEDGIMTYHVETAKSGTRGITAKSLSSSGFLVQSYVETFFWPRIQSWSPATGVGPNPHIP
jgi:hypothetical protein